MAIFLIKFHLNGSICTNQFHSHLVSINKFAHQVCELTKQILNSSPHTQDVLIAKHGGEMWSSTINDIVKCIQIKNAVVLNDFKEIFREKNLRRASVVIAAFDYLDQVNNNCNF